MDFEVFNMVKDAAKKAGYVVNREEYIGEQDLGRIIYSVEWIPQSVNPEDVLNFIRNTSVKAN